MVDGGRVMLKRGSDPDSRKSTIGSKRWVANNAMRTMAMMVAFFMMNISVPRGGVTCKHSLIVALYAGKK
jgi:hypothetical protein